MKKWTYKQRFLVILSATTIEFIVLHSFYAWRTIKLQHEWKNNHLAMMVSGVAVILLSALFNLFLLALHKELRPHVKKMVNIAIYIYRFMALLGYLIVPLVCNKIFIL